MLHIHRRLRSHILSPLSGVAETAFQSDIIELNQLRAEHEALSSLRSREAVTKALLEHNAQIAHDIRSPLSAIHIGLEQMPDTLGKSKTLIQSAVERMQTIAENLLHSNLGTTPSPPSQEEPVSAHEIAPILTSIIEEKKIQLKPRPTLTIQTWRQRQSSMSFVKKPSYKEFSPI